MGMSGWRGERVVKPPPFFCALISNQRSGPVKMPGPKSSVTVNRPLLTTVVALVNGPPATLPTERAS